MKSDYAAHLSLVHDSQDERKKLKAKNMDTINQEKQRKRDINAQFWHSIKHVVLLIACAALAIYTLIHFA
ncbi:hypothetical protein ACS8E2_12635 [Psychrobacter glaciei]|uniref:hypothetical protein n=1 Tax=Psychrobacter glaciei TaxID=619771 RepID=UPI003F45F9A4